MTLDRTARAAALKLIAKFGKSITLTTVTAGAYDPATGAATATTSAKTVKALVEDYSLQASGQGYTSGLIETGDKKVTIAGSALTVEPTTSDKLTIDGVVYTVKNVKIIYSGELAAMYELQGRR